MYVNASRTETELSERPQPIHCENIHTTYCQQFIFLVEVFEDFLAIKSDLATDRPRRFYRYISFILFSIFNNVNKLIF
jgi:hypothetical protein